MKLDRQAGNLLCQHKQMYTQGPANTNTHTSSGKAHSGFQQFESQY